MIKSGTGMSDADDDRGMLRACIDDLQSWARAFEREGLPKPAATIRAAVLELCDPIFCDIAKQVTHEAGFPWTDPRTGVTYPPPTKGTE